MTNFMNIQLPAGMVGSGVIGNPWGGTSSSSSSNDTSLFETYEDYKKRLEKERAEKTRANQAASVAEQLEKDKEVEKKTLGLDAKIKELETTKKDIENNTDKKTGASSIVVKRTKEDSFWTKAGRWFSNAGTVLLNTGKGLVGIEKDGSWNWKKCLTNALVIGGSFAPVIGPVIRGAALVLGTPTTILGTINGISDLKNAKSDKEKDNAQQDIIINATGALLSICSIAKVLKISAGKPFKLLTNAVKKDLAAIKNAGGGIKGFLNYCWQGVKNFNNFKLKYDEKIKNMEAKIQKDMDAIDAELLATPLSEQNKIALLREQKFLLNQNRLELRNLGNVKSKADFDKLLTENSSTKVIERMKGYTRDAAGNYEIYSRSISPSEYKTFMDSMVKNQKAYQKGMNDIVEFKAAIMRKLAKDPTMNATALNEYVPNAPTQTRSIWKPSTYRKNNYQIAIGGNSSGYGIRFMKATLKRPELYAVAYANQMIDPQYSTPFSFGQEFSKEEVKEQLALLDENLAIYKENEKAIDNAKSKEEIAQIVAQLSAQNEQGQTEENQNIEANSYEKSMA